MKATTAPRPSNTQKHTQLSSSPAFPSQTKTMSVKITNIKMISENRPRQRALVQTARTFTYFHWHEISYWIFNGSLVLVKSAVFYIIWKVYGQTFRRANRNWTLHMVNNKSNEFFVRSKTASHSCLLPCWEIRPFLIEFSRRSRAGAGVHPPF